MEFIIGAVFSIAVIGYFLINKKMNKTHEDSALTFPVWATIYDTKDDFDKRLMAKSLMVQSLFLAENYGIIKKGGLKEIEPSLYDDPVTTLEFWIGESVPYIEKVFPQSVLDVMQARVVIMYMILVLNSRNPEEDLNSFIKKTSNLQSGGS